MDAINNPPTLGSITFLTGPMSGNTYPITKSVVTIGREADNDVVISSDASVSRHHAQLAWNNGTWSITKLSLQNTLMVNDRDIPQGQLHDRDLVRLGANTSFRFQIGNALQKSSNAPAGDQKGISRQAGNVPPVVPAQPASLPRKGAGVAPPPQAPFGSPPVSFVPTVEAQLPAQGQPAVQGDVGPVTQRAGEIVGVAPRGIPTVEVSTNTKSEKRVYELMPTKQVFDIGRDPKSDIAIDEPFVSGLHAQIVREGNQLFLIHPHPGKGRTTNGLYYNGRKIQGDERFREELKRGDICRISDEHGTFVTLTYNDGSGATQDIVPEIRPIPLGARVLTIGRLSDNTVVLSHPQVSGHHARLEQVQGGYRIVDTNSTNHVYVNGKQVKDQVLKVNDEIRIGPFKLTYTGTQLTQHDESNSIRVDALHLKKTGNRQVVLLNDISLAIPPRKFVAVVGGSGAGKSTLMDALNGLRPAKEGLVLYNGQNYYQNLAAFSTQLGYVPQEDIIHRDITVEHALYYAAKMRLPDDFTEKQIKQRIEEVLDDVEMKSQRNLLVSKLSGGQRKRVSIALELLANPSLFFLDEPTSGLDPGLDRKMMYLLRKLADAGHTIVLVTHATNNINVCDYVCFLAQGGRLAYFGSPEQARAYFGKTDFAEIYTSLEPTDENPNVPDEAEAKFKLSKEYQEYITEPLKAVSAKTEGAASTQHKSRQRAKRGNPLVQFLLLSQRNFELLKNNRSNLIILLLQAPLIALLLMFLVRFEVGVGLFDPGNVVQCTPHIFTSAVVSDTNPSGLLGITTQGGNSTVDCSQIRTFLQNDPNGIAYAQTKGSVNTALQDFIVPGVGLNAARALFIIAFVAVLFGVINGTREIVKEASIYRRERAVNLGIAPYVFSKVLVFGLFSLFQSAALLLIVNAFEPFQSSIFLPVLLETYITLVLTALAGLMVGLAASTFAANEDSANSLLPFILIPQVVFAGVEIPLKDWPLQIAAVIFPTRWAVTALGSSVGLHSDKLGGDSLFGNNSTFHGTLFSTFTSTEATQRLLLAWGALGALIIALIIVICLGLKRKDVRL